MEESILLRKDSEPPSGYLAMFQTLVFGYRKLIPPDELTRELTYRMLRQKMIPVGVLEKDGCIYVVTVQLSKSHIVLFQITPPENEDPEKKFRGWRYRTIRRPRDMPVEALRLVLKVVQGNSMN